MLARCSPEMRNWNVITFEVKVHRTITSDFQRNAQTLVYQLLIKQKPEEVSKIRTAGYIVQKK